MAQGITVLWNI